MVDAIKENKILLDLIEEQDALLERAMPVTERFKKQRLVEWVEHQNGSNVLPS